MNTSRKILLAVTLALCAAAGSYGQVTTTTPAIRPSEHPDLSRLPPDIRAQILQLQAQRADLRALVAALRDQLKDKTAAERQAIIAQFRHDHAAMIDAQRALAREIRAELRLLREQRKGTG
jgi:uncharacterized protein YlxW (UPF0749 family)